MDDVRISGAPHTPLPSSESGEFSELLPTVPKDGGKYGRGSGIHMSRAKGFG